MERNGVIWAAAQTPPDNPADFAGYKALRSLVIAATPDAIIHASDGEPIVGATKMRLEGHNAILLMNGLGPDEVFVIVLIEADLSVPDRLSVSAAVERLRRAAETAENAA
jgi:hypothetical protein